MASPRSPLRSDFPIVGSTRERESTGLTLTTGERMLSLGSIVLRSHRMRSANDG